MLELLQDRQNLLKVTRWFWHDSVLRKKKRKEGNQSVTDEQLEDKEMGKLMTMSKNIYSMIGVDFLDVNRGDKPFLYM